METTPIAHAHIRYQPLVGRATKDVTNVVDKSDATTKLFIQPHVMLALKEFGTD